MLVTTDMYSNLLALLSDYDGRSGVPESCFCQDNQGLGLRKRRKHKFEAQQVLVLLSQLAHNLTQWLKHWMIQALQQPQENATQLAFWKQLEMPRLVREEQQPVIQTLQERGIKRFVHYIFCLSGQVFFKRGKLQQVVLNSCYPLIHRFQLALEVLLEPYGIGVSLATT